MPEYSIILPDESGERVWTRDGSVPRLDLETTFPARDVELLAEAIDDAFGLSARVVRHIAEEPWIVEIEADGIVSGSWADVDDPAVERWRSSRLADDRAPWEQPGWFAGAVATVVDAVDAAGWTTRSTPVLVKGAWPCSAVLRLDTDAGRFYAKWVGAKPPREPATVWQLTQIVPSLVPELVAVGPDDEWMITADFGSEAVVDHAGALHAFAELQLLVGDDVPGLPDFTPAVLAGRFDDIAGVADRCAELDATGLVPAVVLQDLRAGNVAVGSPFTFFDWTDVVLGHPFFSGIRYLDLFWQVDPVCRWNELHDLADAPPLLLELRDAYLGPFADVIGMDAARRAFALAWSLQGVFMAARWEWEAAHIERDAPWARWLRRFHRNELAQRVPPRIG